MLFDFDNARPTGSMNTWRGSYDEIAMEYDTESQPASVDWLLGELRFVIGGTYQGYKGGEYTMGKTTPVWVDHYGESTRRGVLGVEVTEKAVIIKTGICEY